MNLFKMWHVYERRGMSAGFRRESQKKRGHYEGLDVAGRIILKWFLEKWDGVVWIGFI
jgi:hypothetical protein